MATLNLTEREKNAPAGMSTIDGGYMSGYNPVLPSPTSPAPAASTGVAAPAPEPTIGEQLTGIQNEALHIQDILNQRQAEEQAAAAGSRFVAPTAEPGFLSFDEYGTPVDDEDVNEATLKLFQDQIDATNQVYDQLLTEARLEGEGRLGSGRAMAARGGLLGSDFAASQKAKIQDFNTAEQRSIQAERTAKIGTILGTARREAAQTIADKRAARKAGYENYRQYLADSQDRMLRNVNGVAAAFAAQGIDPSELDEQELATIAGEIGANGADIISAYAGLASEEGDQFTLSEGEQRYDAAGNLIASGPEKQDEGKIYSTSKGLVRVVNGEPELIFASSSGGGGGSTGETFKSGGLQISGGEVAELQNTLNAQRGQDGYTNSGTYLQSLEDWTSNKGLEEDFFKAFPPKEWINPTDTSIPKRIRDKATKSSSGTLTIGGVPLTLGGTETAEEEGPITEEDTGFWSRLFGE